MTDNLRELEAKATPGPWAYRPLKWSDWGTVGVEWSNGWPFVICQARDPRCMDDAELAECRRNGTDPWEANARLIAEMRNALPALLDERDALKAERDENEGVIRVWRRRCIEAEAERDALRAEVARLRVLVSDVVQAWDWWRVDQYDRCQSVPADAINAARAALGSPDA